MEESDRLRLKAMLALLHEGSAVVTTAEVLAEAESAGSLSAGAVDRALLVAYLTASEAALRARAALAASIGGGLAELRARFAS
jgi:hypothetical protein